MCLVGELAVLWCVDGLEIWFGFRTTHGYRVSEVWLRVRVEWHHLRALSLLHGHHGDTDGCATSQAA
jgi:hypothetical protein